MTDLFAWNEDAGGDDDVFFASTSRSIDDGGFHLTIQGDHTDELGDWEEGNFANFESYEHLLSTDVEADSDYAHFLQSQSFEVDNLLSPPPKSSNSKKRVSPAKDIQHKRSKQSEVAGGSNSWKHRPDQMQVLGTSVGSPSSSLGVGVLPAGFGVGHDGLVSPSTTLGVMSDLGMDSALSMFGPDFVDPSVPLATSTPNATPTRPLRTKSGLPSGGSGSASRSSKNPPEWSDEEMRLFEEGLALYGSPNWRQIAALVGSRSAAQVKVFSVKYFNTHGPNVVPHVDPARMEQLRSQYMPTQINAFASPSSMATATTPSGHSKLGGGRLKRGTSAMASPNAGSAQALSDKKLQTPKKPLTGNVGLSTSSSSAVTPHKTPGKTSGKQTPTSYGNKGPPGGLSSSTSSIFSPNSSRVTPGRRKADEQLIVLKKTGDEDEDICIEDEEIDVDGEDDEDQAFLRSVVADEEGDGSVEETEGEHYAHDETSQSSVMSGGRNGYGMDVTGTSVVVASSTTVRYDNVGPARNSAPNTVAGKNHTPQWRQKPNSFLDESGDYLREDSMSAYSDADSSVAGDAMSLSSSMSIAYDSTPGNNGSGMGGHNSNAAAMNHSSHHHHQQHQQVNSNALAMQASAVSIAQALKALGLEGEAWIEDVEIPPPKVLELQEDHVLDLEMQANSEFFEGNAVKTPERYVRIRNHIVRTWAMNKQRYITKTSVRRGLRDCGDVNAIGRVHQFLELVGAINFGLEAPPSCRKQGQPEPLSVLMMNKAPLQMHIQQQQMARLHTPMPYASPINPLNPGAPSYASIASGASSSLPHGRPTVRSQFDPSFEVVKNHPSQLPNLVTSSNILLVIDLHAHLHRRDGFGLIAGHYEAETNTVNLRYAMPYTGPQSSSAAAASLQAVSAWEKSVTAWVEHSSIAKQWAAQRMPLEVLGYYTTHKLNGALSLTQFTHYKNVFGKGPARNRPFVGIFAIPFERTPDSTLFLSAMYPVVAGGVNTATMAGPVMSMSIPGAPPKKTLCLLKRNVYCERKMPQEQFAQLFSAYAESEVAYNLTERDERDPHRSLLDRCLVSLSSAVFVSERDKNAFWEHMRVLATEGVNPKLLSMLNTKDAVWSFKEPPMPIVPISTNPLAPESLADAGHLMPDVLSPHSMSPHDLLYAPPPPQYASYPSHNPNASASMHHSSLSHHSPHPYAPEFGSTAQKLDFSSVDITLSHPSDSLGTLDVGPGLLDHHHLEPRF